jgi:hypothetical protein
MLMNGSQCCGLTAQDTEVILTVAVPGAVSVGVKREGLEAEHSPPSSAEVRNGGAIPPLLHTFLWRNV